MPCCLRGVAPVLLMVTIRFSGVMRNRCMWCGSPSRSLRSGHTSLSVCAVSKSILRTPHRKPDKLFRRQISGFKGAEIEQMAAGADDELNAIAIELFQKIFEHGNYGAFGHAAC